MDWGTGTASRHSNGHGHAHTRTRTHVSAHMGSRAGPGWWHRLGHGPSGEGHGAGGGWGPRAPSGGGCDGTGSRRWCQGGEHHSGKDGVKEPSQAPCSPPPGPCKPLKALLGHLLENGGVLVSFPMKGPSPLPCPLFFRDPLAAVGWCGVGWGNQGVVFLPPRAFPAHDPWHGRQSVGP